LIELFLSLNDSTIRVPVAAAMSRLSVSISDYELKQQKTAVVRPPLRFRSEPESPTLINIDELAGIFHDMSHFVRRSEVTPLQLMAVAGMALEFLVVASGKSLVAFSLANYNEVARTEISHGAVQLVVSPIDPTLIAVASLHHVVIYNVMDGAFTRVNEIELMLEDLGSHIFVSAVEWVPDQPLHLAVVCNIFCKIYDVPSDVLCPYLMYAVDGGELFTSAVFTTRDDEQIGLFATASGQIALHSLAVEGVDGPILVQNFIQSATDPLPQSATLSLCEELNLFFVTASNCDMLISRLSDAIRGDLIPIRFVKIELPLKMPLKYIGQQGVILYFISPHSGCTVSLEFTDNSYETALVNDTGPLRMGLLDGNMACVSICSAGDELFAVSGTNGKLMKLLPAGLDESGIVPEAITDSDEGPVVVPAHFWTQSSPSVSSSIKVIEPESHSDARLLLGHDRFIFNHRLSRRMLHISSTAPSDVIVGVRVCLGLGPPSYVPTWIKVNGRKVDVKGPRCFCFALSPAEVREASVVRLELGAQSTADVKLEGLDVFIVNRTDFPPSFFGADQGRDDWFFNASSAFDFEDATTRRISEPRRQLQDLCTQVIAAGGGRLDSESMASILRLMYRDPLLAVQCRRIVVKCAEPSQQLFEVWGAVIARAVAEKEVHSDMWATLWRDLALLPGDLRNRILEEVWGASPEFAGPFAVITAFLAE
jgi:hypothetical protein